MTKTQAEQVAKEAAKEICEIFDHWASSAAEAIILSRLLPLVEEEAPGQADPNFYIPEPTT